jgi:hypothetical protein
LANAAVTSLLDDPAAVEAVIVSALQPLLPVFALVAEDQTPVPYAVYRGDKSRFEQTLADGIPIDNDHFEVSVYGASYDDTDDAALEVRAALIEAFAAPLAAICTMRTDYFEAALRLFRVAQEFSIWRPRAQA